MIFNRATDIENQVQGNELEIPGASRAITSRAKYVNGVEEFCEWMAGVHENLMCPTMLIVSGWVA